MDNLKVHIHNSIKCLMGTISSEELIIPEDKSAEVARGAAILDAYTMWTLGQKKLAGNEDLDDSYAALNMYIYGAIQLADTFGTEDFHNYYSDYVDNVIIPAIEEWVFLNNELNELGNI